MPEMIAGDRSRRQVLLGGAGVALTLTAGCLGDDNNAADDGGDADDSDDAHGADQADEDPEVEEFPTDPGEDDYADRTGQDEVEVITREGEGDDPEFVFDPPFIAVDPGTTIRWVNEDDVFHTVTSTPDLDDRQGGGELFNEDIAEAGETFEWPVDDPGIYHYYCQPHLEFMWGSIAVLDDGEFPDADTDADDDPADDEPDDEEYTDIPEDLPTDPDDDDFIDLTGQDEAEVYTRQGREGEPNFVFDPPYIRVDQGTTVRWVNKDGVFHTVTSTDSLDNRRGGGDDFDATISSEGDEFTWDADVPGRQDYYCSPHAGFMYGSIRVE